MKWMQRSVVALLVAGVLSVGLVGPAAAQPPNDQDGLVNVYAGDDIVGACVPIIVAVNAIVELCELDVAAAVLGQVRAVDRSSREREFCTTQPEGDVIRATQDDCEG